MLRMLFNVAAVLCVSGSLAAQQAPSAASVSTTNSDQAALNQAPTDTDSRGPSEKPRVFITDSQSWEVSGAGGGANGVYGAESHGGARPQTAEIIKTFGQRCSQVIVNDRQSLADYIVLLDHEGGKGLLRHKNKVAVFQRISGDVVVSHSTLSLGGSVEDACKGIVGDWQEHGEKLLAAKERVISSHPATVQMAMAQQQVSASTNASVAISSVPPGADIEVDGSFVGNTPSTVAVPAGSHEIVVKKKGFADWSRKLSVTGGSIHLDADLEPTKAP